MKSETHAKASDKVSEAMARALRAEQLASAVLATMQELMQYVREQEVARLARANAGAARRARLEQLVGPLDDEPSTPDVLFSEESIAAIFDE